MTRLGELSFEEGWLPTEDGRITEAMWYPEGRIRINPIPHIVDSIVHECLHELFPKYSERAICSLTGKLMKQISAEELQTIYDEYKERVKED